MIKPQLARPFKDGKDDWMWEDPDYCGEEKYDGHRTLVLEDEFRSRTWKVMEPQIEDVFPGKARFDGELIVRPELGIPQGHSEVNHWLSADPSKLKLVLFDCLMSQDGRCLQGVPLYDRRQILEELYVKNIKGYDRVSIGVVWILGKKTIYDTILERGGEGMVLKNLWRPYEQGSRSAWIKKKAWDPVDVVIVDCEASPSEWRVRPGEVDKQTGLVLPEGDHTEPWKLGYVGLSYGFYDEDGRLIKVGSTVITGPQSEMLPCVGKVASFKCYGRQRPTGALNHMVFLEWRDDKPAEDCVFAFNEERRFG